MHDSFISYIFILVAVVAAIYIIKKVTSCLIRSVVFVIAAAIVAVAVYMLTH